MANDSTLKQLEQILAKRQRYTVKGDKQQRNLGANPTIGEINSVLVTLLNDLKKQGILK